MPNGNRDDMMEGSAGNDVKPLTDEVAMTIPEVKDSQINDEHDMFLSSVQNNVKVDANGENSMGILTDRSSIGDVKHIDLDYDNITENSTTKNAALSISLSGKQNTQEVDKTREATIDCHADKQNGLTSEPSLIQQELEESEEGLFTLHKCASEPKLGSAFHEEGGVISKSLALPNQNKIVVCVRRSSSTSSAVMVSKSSDCDKFRSVDIIDTDTNPNAKQQIVSQCNSNAKKERAASDIVKVKDEDNQDLSRRKVNEHPKSSVNSASKPSNSSKSSHLSVIKRALMESKDSDHQSSVKISSAQNSCETTVPQNDCASQVQNKASASGLPLRSEKFNQSGSQSSSQANHAMSMNPPPSTNSSATLSDEEVQTESPYLLI